MRPTPDRPPDVDDLVRLTHDVPELSLHRGMVGVVRSTWFAPLVTYEVEFRQPGNEMQTRCLLKPEQVELDNGVPFGYAGRAAASDA